jgi:hypothetical protein
LVITDPPILMIVKSIYFALSKIITNYAAEADLNM